MTQNKTKISLVISSLAAGGAERVMSILANNWAKRDEIEVELIVLSNGNNFYDISPKVKIKHMGFPLHNNGFTRIFDLIKLFWNLRMHQIKSGPRFVLSFMTKYNIFILLALYKSGIATIVSERDSPSEKISKWMALMRKHLYGLSSGAVCQTELAKIFIMNNTGMKNVIVIPNPISIGAKDGVIQKEKIVLNVGRLVQKKGQKYLLQAFAKVRNNGWSLVLLGDGELTKELKNLSKKLKISDKILLNGTTCNVTEWYQKSSIFAFPSILEGYPNALAEAMCHGLACVSFDCETGPSEMIEDGVNGFLVEEKNTEEFAAKLQALMDNSLLRSDFAREASKLRYLLDEELISSKYLEFCMSIEKGV